MNYSIMITGSDVSIPVSGVVLYVHSRYFRRAFINAAEGLAPIPHNQFIFPSVEADILTLITLAQGEDINFDPSHLNSLITLAGKYGFDQVQERLLALR